jgi:hypothetical protein
VKSGDGNYTTGQVAAGQEKCHAMLLPVVASMLSAAPVLLSGSSVFVSKGSLSRRVSPSTSFRAALSSPLRYDSEGYSNEKFTGPKGISDAGTWSFVSCLFQGCQSKSNGGGIAVGGKEARLKVSKTGFAECSAEKGGAIYAEGSELDVAKSCVRRCSATRYSGLFASTSSGCDVCDCWLTDLSEQKSESVVAVDYARALLRSSNVSHVNLLSTKSVVAASGESTSVQELYFGQCESSAVLTIPASGDPLRTVNFVKNSAKDYLVKVTGSSWMLIVSFLNCAFIRDNSRCVVNRLCVLTACVFSDAYDPSQFPSECHTVQCSFGAGWKPQDMDVVPSEACWALLSQPSKPQQTGDGTRGTDVPAHHEAKKGLSAVVVLTVALVVIGLIGLLFFLYRKVCSRDEYGVLFKMYSQV